MKYLCSNGHINDHCSYVLNGIKPVCIECLNNMHPLQNVLELLPVYKIPPIYTVTKQVKITESSKTLDLERRMNELEASFNALANLIKDKLK